MRTHQTIIAFLGHNFNDTDCGFNFTFNYDGSSQFKIRLAGWPGRVVFVRWTDTEYTWVRFDRYTYKDVYSNYKTNGTYDIKVTGSCYALKFIEVIDQPNVTLNLTQDVEAPNLIGAEFKGINVSGDIAHLQNLNRVKYVRINSPGLSGDVSVFSNKNEITHINLSGTSVSGDLSAFSGKTDLRYLILFDTNIDGDISAIHGDWNLLMLDIHNTSIVGDVPTALIDMSLKYLDLSNTQVEFTTITNKTHMRVNYAFFAHDCALPSDQVDNALMTLADSAKHSGSINLGGTNAPHTSLSDYAINRLIANGSNVKVN